jgi:hypothetical protein
MKQIRKIQSVLAFAGTLFFAVVMTTYAQPGDKRTRAVDAVRANVDRQVAEAEGDDPSSVFIMTFEGNGKLNPYPAVGIFTTKLKFYYTYGDREKNPYPDRLIKIVVETRRSANTEKTEVVFDETREMLFYRKKVEGDETSEKLVYFARGRAFRVENNGKKLSVTSREAGDLVRLVTGDSNRLKMIFKASLME